MRFLTEQADVEILGTVVRIRQKGSTTEYSWDDLDNALRRNEMYLFAGTYDDDNSGQWVTKRDVAEWVKDHKWQLQYELKNIDSILKDMK